MQYVFLILYLAFIVGTIVAMWKMFEKAGKPGWASIVPIYNIITLLEIVGRPLWFIVLFFLPIANFIALILIMLDLAKSFGKSTGFGVGLILLSPVFIMMLGFGDATYVGPAAAGGAQGQAE